MSSVLAFIPSIVFLVSVATAILTLWNALLALRAKARFREALRARVLMDLEARTLVTRLAEHRRLTPVDEEAARLIIEQIAEEALSQSDTRWIEKGLYQKSKTGEKRYISDLLTAH